MPNANSAAPTPQSTDTDERPLYIWLKEPQAPSSPVTAQVDQNTYLVYNEDGGTDRPRNPYGQH